MCLDPTQATHCERRESPRNSVRQEKIDPIGLRQAIDPVVAKHQMPKISVYEKTLTPRVRPGRH
jgi:hypothetical protein